MGLLDLISSIFELPYLSDLHWATPTEAQRAALCELDVGAYSIEEFQATANYILNNDQHFQTTQQAKDAILVWFFQK